MPRAKIRPLSGNARLQLRRGILRSFRPHDSLASVAERLGQPERRIAEAMQSAIFEVRDHWGRGVSASDIVEATGLPRPFVLYAMARTAARRDAHKRDYRRRAPRAGEARKSRSRTTHTKKEAPEGIEEVSDHRPEP